MGAYAWLPRLRPIGCRLRAPRSSPRTLCSASNDRKPVYIALGSNLGDRAGYIRSGIREISRHVGPVLETSFLYESSPMYLTNQPAFLNAVVCVQTPLHPRALLSVLQQVEDNHFRDRNAPRNGPRTLDLDIVLYGDDIFVDELGALEIPHERVRERDFVLQPLADIDGQAIIPSKGAGRARQGEKVETLLASLKQQSTANTPAATDATTLTRVTPLRTSTSGFLRWDGAPKMMGILNATPDSFSDGGKMDSISACLSLVEEFRRHGFHIIDIGGQSTRPGAELVSQEEELNRVLPIIQAVRKEHGDLAISVDTFRAPVASAALDAGADIVNDVAAGMLDQKMEKLVLSEDAVYCMMHMRGTPQTMQTPAMTNYGERGVVNESASELATKIRRLLKHGFPRWSLMVDPGIGFAKTAPQSVELVKNMATWIQAAGGFPCLVGLSRKSSLRSVVPRLSEAPAHERDFATAGAVCAALIQGAQVFRVHDPRVADALFAMHAMIQCGQVRAVGSRGCSRVVEQEAA